MPDEFALVPLEEFPAALLLLTAEAETDGVCTGGVGGNVEDGET